MGLRVLYNSLLATRCVGVFETIEPPLGVDCSTSYGVPQVKRPYRIGGHPMVIWMWCLSPMDDRDGGPLRADVSLFRFQPLVYILFVCSLADCYLGFGCLGFGNSRSS